MNTRLSHDLLNTLIVMGVIFLSTILGCGGGNDGGSSSNDSIGSTYKVYGGNTFTSETNGYHPADYGYTLLGSASSTKSFSGSYNYYIIVTSPFNVAYVDAVQGSNGYYYGTNNTGNTLTYSNISGAPDNNACAVGGLFDGTSGGFVLINASNNSLTSITVYIMGEGSGGGSEQDTRIGIDGGTILINDYGSPLEGFKMEIPPGALDKEILISIQTSDSPPPYLNGNFEILGKTIILKPSGTKFNKPVEVTIPYDPSIDEEKEAIVIAHYDETNDEWEVPTLINFDPHYNTLTVELFHFSEIVKLKPTISSSITTTPEFNINKDAFDIKNNSNDLNYTSCRNTFACWGFTHASQWFFENKRDDQCFLRNAYSYSDSAKIVCEAQDYMSKPLSCLLKGIAEIGSLITTTDHIVCYYMIAALFLEKSPQHLNIAPSWYNVNSGHSLLVVSWDNTKKVFKVYDPNDNSKLKEIPYNNFTGKLGPYKFEENKPSWEWFARVNHSSLDYRNKVGEIFQKYPTEPGSCLPSINDYVGDYSGTININFTDGDSSFIGDHEFSISFYNPNQVQDGLYLFSCLFERIITGEFVDIDSETHGTAMCQVFLGHDTYPDGTFSITGGIGDMSNYVGITGRIEDNKIHIGTNGDKGSYTDKVNDKVYLGYGTLSKP